mgnify:FL=1
MESPRGHVIAIRRVVPGAHVRRDAQSQQRGPAFLRDANEPSGLWGNVRRSTLAQWTFVATAVSVAASDEPLRGSASVGWPHTAATRAACRRDPFAPPKRSAAAADVCGAAAAAARDWS